MEQNFWEICKNSTIQILELLVLASLQTINMWSVILSKLSRCKILFWIEWKQPECIWTTLNRVMNVLVTCTFPSRSKNKRGQITTRKIFSRQTTMRILISIKNDPRKRFWKFHTKNLTPGQSLVQGCSALTDGASYTIYRAFHKNRKCSDAYNL